MAQHRLQSAALCTVYSLVGGERVSHVVQAEILDAGAADGASEGDGYLVRREGE
jgi:hypothetical protein